MTDGNGLSAGDILALTKNNNSDSFGGNFWWVIVFFIVAGMFGGGNLFGRSNLGDATLTSDEFIKRDIFNTNQNVSETAARTQQEVLSTSCQTQKDTLENRYTTQLGLQQLQASQKDCCCETNQNIMQNRYDNAIGQCNISKDMLLGQSNLQKDILLGNKDMQAQLAECCCDLKTNIHLEAEATRNLIQQNHIADLSDKLSVARAQISNYEQSQYLLNTMGRYNVVSVPASCGCNTNFCGGYTPYGYYGVSSIV